MKLPLNDPRLSYSDCFHAEVTPERVAFSRPHWDVVGNGYVQPGARVRVTTDATHVTLRCVNTGKITRDDLYSPLGAVFIDGKFAMPMDAGTFSTSPQNFAVEVVSDDAQLRLIEFILPIGASVEIIGLELNDGANIVGPPPRPELLYVAYGDSITQGYAAPCVDASWAFRLAQRAGWRMISLGYGGRKATADDGIVVGELKPNIVTYMLGYNDFSQQINLAAFRAAVHGALENILRLSPGARIFVITPLWAFRGRMQPLTLEQYRQNIRDVVAGLQSPNVHLIEGEFLAGPDRVTFPDGTHPGDLGNTQIFIALLRAIQALA